MAVRCGLNISVTGVTVRHHNTEQLSRMKEFSVVTKQPLKILTGYMDRDKRIWYLSPMRAAKVQARLCIRTVSSEPPLLAHTSSESRGTFRQKARSLAPLNGWACAVKICHDGMLEDTNSLDGAHILLIFCLAYPSLDHCRYMRYSVNFFP